MRDKISSQHTEGTPTSVIVLPTNPVNKLQEGPPLVLPGNKFNIFLWLLSQVGWNLDVGGHRCNTEDQGRHNLDIGRHARGNPDLDHRQIIQQEESGRPFGCWLDNILQTDWTMPNRIILGKVVNSKSKLLPSRNAWPVRPPFFGTRNQGIPAGVGVDSHNIVQ